MNNAQPATDEIWRRQIPAISAQIEDIVT